MEFGWQQVPGGVGFVVASHVISVNEAPASDDRRNARPLVLKPYVAYQVRATKVHYIGVSWWRINDVIIPALRTCKGRATLAAVADVLIGGQICERWRAGLDVDRCGKTVRGLRPRHLSYRRPRTYVCYRSPVW